jgi:hypothetical protein
MRSAFPRVYRSFEEFEREELHRLDTLASIDDMLDEMFADELDFDAGAVKKSRRREEAEKESDDAD